MKRLKIFFAVLLSTLLLFRTPVYAYYDPQTSIEYNDILAPIYFEASLPDLNNISGTMGTYVIRATPTELFDLFIQEGVRIYVTQSVPKSERATNQGVFDGITYAATTYRDSSNKITKITAPVSIYIYSNSFRADTYFHECGHALDDIAEYITGYYSPKPISNSAEWQALYKTYAATMASFDGNASVNMYKASEGFAEAFRLYFSYPGQLKASCPEVYNFVATQIAKYTAYVPALCYDNFDELQYAFDYPDVAAVYGYDKKALWDHYINYGKAEGRKADRYVTPKR